MTKIKNLPQNHATSRLPNTITLSPQWKPTWSGEGAYLRGFTSASTRRARWRDAATYDHNKQIFPMLMPRKRKRKNLDQSPIFSTFSLLPGFRSWPTYILYQHILSFREHNISIVFSPVCRLLFVEFRLWRRNTTFLEKEIKKPLHKKWSFLLRVSSVNATKSAGK